jgi:hypothetical protein
MNALHLRRSFGARAVMLAAIVAAGTAACQSGAGTLAGAPSPEAATPAAIAPAAGPAQAAPVADLSDPAIRTLLADIEAAARRHDQRAFGQYRAQLIARIGALTVTHADATYRQTLANLNAADAAHDIHARAMFHAELNRLCEGALVRALERCDAVVAR